MTKRKWPLLMLLVTVGAVAAIEACSETGPDAGPRTNGCIGASCFDGATPESGPGTNPDGGGGPDGPVVYGDPLAGTTMTATLVKGGYQFAEGPVWIGDRLLFSETTASPSAIHQLFSDGGIGIFRQPASGPNGNAVDSQGRLITCESTRQRVSRTDAQLANNTPLASTFNGKPFNAPNDVIARADGNVYFTDPFYGTIPDGGLPQDKEAVYRVAPAGGAATRLAFDFVKPNGIALSPDGNTLYIMDNGDGRLLSAALAADGTLNGTFTKVADADGGDGMAVDLANNLYIAATAGILVFDVTGKSLGTVTIPAGTPSNCTFGGGDRQTLYITSNNGPGDAATGLYSIHLNVPGLP